MRIIFNVDDLGLHPAVCRAVLKTAEVGTVSSTTVLANGPCAKKSVVEVREAFGDRVGIGVHLNVLRGRPLSPPERIPTLVAPETGLFLGKWSALFLRYLGGRIDPADVEREWDAQIAAVCAMGIRPTHLDGEKHTQAFPTWFNIACRLAKKHGIRWVRRPRERGALMDFSTPGLRLKVLNSFALFHRTVPGVGFPHRVWGIADQGERLSPEGLTGYMARTPGTQVLEVVCHPGAPEPGDPELPKEFGSLRVEKQWEAECRALLAQTWKTAVSRAGGEIVHYGMISPS